MPGPAGGCRAASDSTTNASTVSPPWRRRWRSRRGEPARDHRRGQALEVDRPGEGQVGTVPVVWRRSATAVGRPSRGWPQRRVEPERRRPGPGPARREVRQQPASGGWSRQVARPHQPSPLLPRGHARHDDRRLPSTWPSAPGMPPPPPARTPCPGPAGRFLQFVRHGIIGPGGRVRAMPGVPVGIHQWVYRACQRAVGMPTLGQTRRPVDDRPRQRMPKAHEDTEFGQSGLGGRGSCFGAYAEARGRTPHQCRVTGGLRRGHHEQATRHVGNASTRIL